MKITDIFVHILRKEIVMRRTRRVKKLGFQQQERQSLKGKEKGNGGKRWSSIAQVRGYSEGLKI